MDKAPFCVEKLLKNYYLFLKKTGKLKILCNGTDMTFTECQI